MITKKEMFLNTIAFLLSVDRFSNFSFPYNKDLALKVHSHHVLLTIEALCYNKFHMKQIFLLFLVL